VRHELPWNISVELVLDRFKQRAAACARSDGFIDDGEDFHHGFPGFLLCRRRFTDGERAAIVGVIAAKADAVVEDITFTGLGVAVARNPATRGRLEILPEVSKGFA